MFQKVLVLAPHTDDGEVGCGGTISRYVEEEKEIYYVAFSSARRSLKKGLPEDILEHEVKAATEILGVKSPNLILFDYEVRTFPTYRQEILEDIIKLKSKINPDLVFAPSLNDIHQDHQVIAREALRAFKKVTILGYEEPWNNIVFKTRSFVVLEKKHVKKKVDALRCYESQKHRAYLDEAFIWGLAHTRGTQVEVPYAEAFEVLRLVIN